MLVSRSLAALNRIPNTFIRCISSTPHFRSSYGNSGVNAGSAQSLPRRTLTDIQQLYRSGTPISVVTAHDYITAKYSEAAGIDIVLVGDSLAMVALGYEDTNEVPFDEFLYHVKSVSRGNKSSFLVADVPFGSFETSPKQALETAITLVKVGKAQAVKMECGKEQLEYLRQIVDMGIPVMGHVGVTPQRHNALGGFKLQGNSTDRAVSIFEECLQLQANGAFAIVLECIPNKLAQYITEKLTIPTIGIGAGPFCSGQVLVAADMLGMNNPNIHKAKFVKQYDLQFERSVNAYKQYIEDLKSAEYPSAELHGYKMKRDVLEQFKQKADQIN
ncbi:3-methyl-2-oxobutanoate hydroxymethyltransferase [[Candida] railenensis]|uniref:3-methyl-2-oxobutanoate hydroxymethyltransferase n=1 Tax=[Candida] railenensis TaxID=45579 RepID=A0A9P0VXM4_9ASCO|nr:3-methyl-2-oxobutanoate hydroxymethyltransferase [[Candida] railenensis]